MNFYGKLKSAYFVLLANLFKNYKKPLSVYFLITYRCPFKCKYCNITKIDAQKAELSTQDALALIDEMARAGTVKLQFTGGEPMMRQDLGVLIAAAKRHGMFVGVSTSGYSVPERIADLKGVDIVFLSLEGNRETHESIRGTGSFQVLEDAMTALKNNNITYWTTSVINKRNFKYIDYILDWANRENFKANFVMLHSREEDYLDCFDNQEVADSFHMTDEQFRNIIADLKARKMSGSPIGTSETYFDHLLNWPDYKQLYSMVQGPKQCWAGRLYAYIEPDGMVYACGTLREKMPGRDAVKEGFLTAFKNLPAPFCRSCLSGCQTEQNLMFSMDLKTIRNWLKLIKL